MEHLSEEGKEQLYNCLDENSEQTNIMLFPPSHCKQCTHLSEKKCTRKSIITEKIGVCWFEEEY